MQPTNKTCLRRVLSWVVGLAVAGVLLWVLAVATPYWTIQIYPHDPRYLSLFVSISLHYLL